MTNRSEASPENFHVAEAAFQAFCQGLSGHGWADFLDQLSDDFSFWFPAGTFQGLNHGRQRAQEFFEGVERVFPDGLTLEVLQVTSNATTVVFEVRSQGAMLGRPYENQAAIAFEIKAGKVCSYREYLGVIFQLA